MKFSSICPSSSHYSCSTVGGTQNLIFSSSSQMLVENSFSTATSIFWHNYAIVTVFLFFFSNFSFGVICNLFLIWALSKVAVSARVALAPEISKSVKIVVKLSERFLTFENLMTPLKGNPNNLSFFLVKKKQLAKKKIVG